MRCPPGVAGTEALNDDNDRRRRFGDGPTGSMGIDRGAPRRCIEVDVAGFGTSLADAALKPLCRAMSSPSALTSPAKRFARVHLPRLTGKRLN